MYRRKISLVLVFLVVLFCVHAETQAARSIPSDPIAPAQYAENPSTTPSTQIHAPQKVNTIFFPFVSASPPIRVLCDGQVFDGYTTIPFQLKSPGDLDPNFQKVIRNCVFRNSSLPAIVIKNARNVLIEGSTFENIRTFIPGVGVHAINIPCDVGCVADNITIRNNTFRYIGADGIQLGEETNNISHVYIQNNEFVGRDDVGENAVDVKGVIGPIYIGGNSVHGFRPCESPKTNPPGTQDCSGSIGDGIILHNGGSPIPTSPMNVTLENNFIYDNSYGLTVSTGSQNIIVRGNRIDNNLVMGFMANNIYSIAITNNTLSYNPIQIKIQYSPMSGGSCIVGGNVFVGSGEQLNIQSSTCY